MTRQQPLLRAIDGVALRWRGGPRADGALLCGGVEIAVPARWGRSSTPLLALPEGERTAFMRTSTCGGSNCATSRARRCPEYESSPGVYRAFCCAGAPCTAAGTPTPTLRLRLGLVDGDPRRALAHFFVGRRRRGSRSPTGCRSSRRPRGPRGGGGALGRGSRRFGSGAARWRGGSHGPRKLPLQGRPLRGHRRDDGHRHVPLLALPEGLGRGVERHPDRRATISLALGRGPDHPFAPPSGWGAWRCAVCGSPLPQPGAARRGLLRRPGSSTATPASASRAHLRRLEGAVDDPRRDTAAGSMHLERAAW
jgi:hypothetical protein